jgi:hypothetical protein
MREVPHRANAISRNQAEIERGRAANSAKPPTSASQSAPPSARMWRQNVAVQATAGHVGPNGVESVPENVQRAITIRQTSDLRIGSGWGFKLGDLQIGPLMQGYRLDKGEDVVWTPGWNPPSDPSPQLLQQYSIKIFAHTAITYDHQNLQRLNQEVNNVPASK